METTSEHAQVKGPSARRSGRASKAAEAGKGGEKKKDGNGGKGSRKCGIEDLQAAGVGPSIAPAGKCPRKSTANPANTFSVSEDAPEWFKKAFAMLSSLDCGEEWTRTLECWGRLESEAGYAGNLKLGTKGRPDAIKDWIQRARSTTWRPTIRDPKVFGSQVSGWWLSLQPDWRIEEGGGFSRTLDGDFEDLRRPGINGLLSIIAGLFFWGNSLQDEARSNEAWMSVVSDVQFVLANLTSSV